MFYNIMFYKNEFKNVFEVARQLRNLGNIMRDFESKHRDGKQGSSKRDGDIRSTSLEMNVPKIQTINPVNIVKLNYVPHDYLQSFLVVNNKEIAIFIHRNGDYISSNILRFHIWGELWITQMLNYTFNKKRILLLDLGCNLGVYTLAAASLGYRVIAVDSNKNNTDRLVQSVMTNKLKNNVIVILNAISNVWKTFSLKVIDDKIGGHAIIPSYIHSYKVKSILMDQLVPLIPDDAEIIIKMDIRGSEIDAMRNASVLFATRNVSVVLMVWEITKKDKDCGVLINFFFKRSYKPYPDFFSKIELDAFRSTEWPYDIVWRKDH